MSVSVLPLQSSAIFSLLDYIMKKFVASASIAVPPYWSFRRDVLKHESQFTESRVLHMKGSLWTHT